MKKIFITIILMLVISLFPNVVLAKTIEPDYSWYGNGDKQIMKYIQKNNY